MNLNYDYKNHKWIVKQFNQAVREAKEYLEAVELDNEELQKLKICSFGYNIGKLSELAVKHLLYNYDNYSDSDDKKSPPFKVLWKRLCSMKCTTVKEKIDSLHFTIINDKDYRNEIYNDEKHKGQPPDWNKCLEFYKELRKLIVNFIAAPDTEAVENFDDPDEKDLIYSANDFSPGSGYNYVLITDKIGNVDVSDLFRIPWTAVFDFDAESEQPGGAFYRFKHEVPNNFSEQFTYSERVNRMSTAVHWVSIYKRNNINQLLNDKYLNKDLKGKFHNFVESFCQYQYKPIIAVVSMNDSAYKNSLNAVIDELNTYCIYYDEDERSKGLKYIVLNGSSISPSPGSIDEEILEEYPFSLSRLVEIIRENIAAPVKETDGYLFPAADSEKVAIPDSLYRSLRDYADPVYIGIENDRELERIGSPEDFYRGVAGITWKMLSDGNVAYTQSIFKDCKSKIEKIHNKTGPNKAKLFYKRGMGGTTFIKRLAYEFHDQYPVLMLNSYVRNYTADEIEKLYNYCKTKIMIFIDSNALYNEQVETLHKELNSRSFNSTIVHLCSPNGNTLLPRLEKFTDDDCKNMKELIISNLDLTTEEGCKRRDKLLAVIASPPNEDYRSPFFLNMRAYEKDFEGIEQYVENTLKLPALTDRTMVETYKEILFVISLTHWANISIGKEYFEKVYSKNITKTLTDPICHISPLITCEKNSKGEVFFRTRYYRFSEQVLKALSGSDSKEISFDKLTDRLITFIRNSRGDETSVVNKAIIDVLRRLFIERDFDIRDNDKDSGLKCYSPIIEKLIEESKQKKHTTGDAYDSDKDNVIRLYKELTACYPNEAHFHAHLARYYFYQTKDYVNGTKSIDKSIAIAENENDNDTLSKVYHIKGMGFRSKIYETISDEGRKIRDQEQKADHDNNMLKKDIKNYLESLDRDCAQAYACFAESSEKGGFNIVYSAISECQLRIRMQQQYNDIKKICSKNGLGQLVDEDKYMANYDELLSRSGVLDNCLEFYEGGDSNKQDNTIEKIERIKLDIAALSENIEEVIAYCRQCLDGNDLRDKSHCRHLLARKQLELISNDIGSDENQKKLLEAIRLLEENIYDDPANGDYIRSWFNAVRKLKLSEEEALGYLENCRDKIENWIKSGGDSLNAYFYRYIIRFLIDYENGSLPSGHSQATLKEMLADVKKRCKVVYKTNVVFWISNLGIGMQRLLTNAEFNTMGSADKLKTLQLFEGRLPAADSFEKGRNSAYIDFYRSEVFFLPTAISKRISRVNARDFVQFSIGFSYDGIRSYYDSIDIIVGEKKDVTRYAGDKVYIQVTNHNSAWVEGIVDGENTPVIINRNNLREKYDPDNNIWPERGTLLYVELLYQKDYQFLAPMYRDEKYKDLKDTVFAAKIIDE